MSDGKKTERLLLKVNTNIRREEYDVGGNHTRTDGE